VITVHGGLPGLRARRLHRWDTMLARWRGFTLDAQLAAGAAPDSAPLLAVRARMLVAPARRDRLARDWNLLVRTASERRAGKLGVPLCRDRILAAAPDILAMQQALRARLPVPVRGVALAGSLLADATGPVYNRRSPVDLRDAVRAAVACLDPAAGLMPDEAT